MVVRSLLHSFHTRSSEGSQPRDGPLHTPFGRSSWRLEPEPILHTWMWIRGVICRDCIGGLDRQVALPILGWVCGGSLGGAAFFWLVFRRVCFWRVLCKVLWGSGYTLPERLEVGWVGRRRVVWGVLSSIGI